MQSGSPVASNRDSLTSASQVFEGNRTTSALREFGHVLADQYAVPIVGDPVVDSPLSLHAGL